MQITHSDGKTSICLYLYLIVPVCLQLPWQQCQLPTPGDLSLCVTFQQGKKYLQAFNSEKNAEQVHVSRSIFSITTLLVKSRLVDKSWGGKYLYILILLALLSLLLSCSCGVNENGEGQISSLTLSWLILGFDYFLFKCHQTVGIFLIKLV